MSTALLAADPRKLDWCRVPPPSTVGGSWCVEEPIRSTRRNIRAGAKEAEKHLDCGKPPPPAVDYLQKHLAELNKRINWNIPGHAALGWPAHMDPRVPVEDKVLAIGAIADIAKLLLELGGGGGAYLHTDFWGLQAGNYSGDLAKCIKKANNYLAKQTFNLGTHGMGLISQADATLLRENGYGGTQANPLMFSFGTFAGKEVEVFSFDYSITVLLR